MLETWGLSLNSISSFNGLISSFGESQNIIAQIGIQIGETILKIIPKMRAMSVLGQSKYSVSSSSFTYDLQNTPLKSPE